MATEPNDVITRDILATIGRIDGEYTFHNVEDEPPFSLVLEYLDLVERVVNAEAFAEGVKVRLTDLVTSDSLMPLSRAIVSVEVSRSPDETLDRLEAVSNALDQLISSAVAPSDPCPDASAVVDLRSQLELIRTRRELLDIKASARRELGEVSRIATATAEAAGVVSDGTLASHFQDVVATERRSCTTWLGLALLSLLILAVGVPLALMLLVDDDWHIQLRVLTFTLPLVALVVWCLRNYAHHRAVALWARVISVQLLTLDAYLAGLEPDQRSSVRAEFGARVFGRHAPSMDHSPEVSDLVDILKTAVDGLAGQPSRS